MLALRRFFSTQTTDRQTDRQTQGQQTPGAAEAAVSVAAAASDPRGSVGRGSAFVWRARCRATSPVPLLLPGCGRLFDTVVCRLFAPTTGAVVEAEAPLPPTASSARPLPALAPAALAETAETAAEAAIRVDRWSFGCFFSSSFDFTSSSYAARTPAAVVGTLAQDLDQLWTSVLLQLRADRCAPATVLLPALTP